MREAPEKLPRIFNLKSTAKAKRQSWKWRFCWKAWFSEPRARPEENSYKFSQKGEIPPVSFPLPRAKSGENSQNPEFNRTGRTLSLSAENSPNSCASLEVGTRNWRGSFPSWEMKPRRNWSKKSWISPDSRAIHFRTLTSATAASELLRLTRYSVRQFVTYPTTVSRF